MVDIWVRMARLFHLQLFEFIKQRNDVRVVFIFCHIYGSFTLGIFSIDNSASFQQKLGYVIVTLSRSHKQWRIAMKIR